MITLDTIQRARIAAAWHIAQANKRRITRYLAASRCADDNAIRMFAVVFGRKIRKVQS